VIVRPVDDGYELVAGERRWRAAEIAGEATIPALVDDGLDQGGSLELALIENIVREDLSPIEQARTFSVLLDDLRMTSAVLATRIGRSRADIANTMRLLDLPDEVVEMIDSGALTKGHGKVLLTEPDHHRRFLLARHAAERGWSVRALENEIARTAKPPAPRSSPDSDQRAVATRLEEAITRAIGCQATEKPYRNGFQILLDHPAADRLARALGADMGAL
jgi:ParB family chromosome partitioning protein